eukprot:1181995-Prorocentrum_minimum.AAC.3
MPQKLPSTAENTLNITGCLTPRFEEIIRNGNDLESLLVPTVYKNSEKRSIPVYEAVTNSRTNCTAQYGSACSDAGLGDVSFVSTSSDLAASGSCECKASNSTLLLGMIPPVSLMLCY